MEKLSQFWKEHPLGLITGIIICVSMILISVDYLYVRRGDTRGFTVIQPTTFYFLWVLWLITYYSPRKKKPSFMLITGVIVGASIAIFSVDYFYCAILNDQSKFFLLTSFYFLWVSWIIGYYYPDVKKRIREKINRAVLPFPLIIPPCLIISRLILCIYFLINVAF